MIRTLLAPNASAMTLDGTRTFIVGRDRVAIIDPGSADPTHLSAVVDAAHAGTRPTDCVILLTHTHPDHASGADELARRLDADVRAIARGNLAEGDTIHTDAGGLVTLATPGHTLDHASFWLAADATVFCGDLMMGGLDTALVAPPEGNLRDYLESLERIRALAPKTILPAHGPPFDDATDAIDRYVEHRRARCAQVARALAGAGPLTSREVAERIYRDEVPETLWEAAVSAVVAYLDYLNESGSIQRVGDRWRVGPA